MGLLDWLWKRSRLDRGQPASDGREAVRNTLAIPVDPAMYPTREELVTRLRESGILKPDAISWVADLLHRTMLTTAGYEKCVDTVVQDGEPLSDAEKSSIGVHRRTKVGRRFVDGLAATDFRDARRRLFLLVQAASSAANLAYSLGRMREAGVKEVRLSSCRDERDCAEARRRDGETMPIGAARLPLSGCDTEYCRCVFIAVIDID